MSDIELVVPYEYRIIRGLKPTEADAIQDRKIVRERMREALSVQMSVTDENGVQVVTDPLSVIVSRKLMADMTRDDPEHIDLNSYAKLLGEDKDDGRKESALDVFAGIVVEEKPDGTRTGQ